MSRVDDSKMRSHTSNSGKKKKKGYQEMEKAESRPEITRDLTRREKLFSQGRIKEDW